MAKKVYKVVRRAQVRAEIFKKWAEWEVDDYIIGKYIGSYQDKYKKDNFVFQIEDSSFQSVEDADGKKVKVSGKLMALNHCGSLGNQMGEVTVGELVQVTYTGKRKVKGGDFAGEDCHTVDVAFVAEEGAEDTESDDVQYVEICPRQTNL